MMWLCVKMPQSTRITNVFIHHTISVYKNQWDSYVLVKMTWNKKIISFIVVPKRTDKDVRAKDTITSSDWEGNDVCLRERTEYISSSSVSTQGFIWNGHNLFLECLIELTTVPWSSLEHFPCSFENNGYPAVTRWGSLCSY